MKIIVYVFLGRNRIFNSMQKTYITCLGSVPSRKPLVDARLSISYHRVVHHISNEQRDPDEILGLYRDTERPLCHREKNQIQANLSIPLLSILLLVYHWFLPCSFVFFGDPCFCFSQICPREILRSQPHPREIPGTSQENPREVLGRPKEYSSNFINATILQQQSEDTPRKLLGNFKEHSKCKPRKILSYLVSRRNVEQGGLSGRSTGLYSGVIDSSSFRSFIGLRRIQQVCRCVFSFNQLLYVL